MRIAMVGNFGFTGNQTMAVRALPIAECLAKHGHAVQLVIPIRRPEDREGPQEHDGVRIRYTRPGVRVVGISHVWQLLQMCLHCVRWRPDVVYGFKPIAFSGTVLYFFWWLRRLGVYRGIVALDTDDWEGKGGWSDRLPVPTWIKVLIAHQERWCLHNADLTTVASRELQTTLQKAGYSRTFYIPNALASSSPGLQSPSGIDLRAHLGLRGRPVVLLYTRFVEFEAGRVLDLFKRILDKAANATLLVVGKGLNGEDVELEKAATNCGISEQLHMAGWVAAEELPDYLAAADVAIYPMDDTLLNRSKCPMKLLELLAAGVPVVADRVGQACEYIADGRTGILVDPGDLRAMAGAVVSLLEDPIRRRSMGDAAKCDVRTRWSWAKWALVVEEILTAYSTTRSESAPAPPQALDPR